MAKEKSSRAGSAMGGKKSKKGKKHSGRKVHKMHIRRAANGGYIAEHSFQPEQNAMGVTQQPEPEEHQIGDVDQLQQHVAEHMAPEEEEQGQQAQGGGGGAAMA